MAKKGSKSYYIKKVKEAFSLYVRNRSGNVCEARELGHCGGRLHCSHIKSTKAYPNLRFHPLNALALCAVHHLYWWHREPFEAVRWVQKKFPDRIKELGRIKNEMFHPTIDDLKDLLRLFEENA